MATGDVTTPNQLAEALADAFFGSGTFKMALANLPGGFDKDTDNYWSDVSTNEISASGYTAGGETVSGVATTRDDAADRIEIDFADVTWAALAATTITHAILYKDTGTPATSVIVQAIEVGDSNGNDYKIAPPAGGAIHITT